MTTVLANNAFESLPMRIPQRFAPTSINRSPRAVRNRVRLRPEQNGTYGPAQFQINFTLPATGVADFINGGLMFNAKTTFSGGTGTYARFHNGIWNIIQRICIKQGGRMLEDCQGYGRFAHFVYMLTRENGFDSVIGGSLFGIDSAANRTAKGASGSDYFIPLMPGFFNMQPFDLSSLAGPITIEIYLNQPPGCMECDQTNTTIDYTVTNVMLHYERIDFENSNTQNEAILRDGTLKFTTFKRYDQPVSTANVDLVVPHRTNAVDTLITVQNVASELADVTKNDRFETFLFSNAVSYQAMINGGLFPQEAIQSGVDSYVNYLTFSNRWTIHGIFQDTTGITLAQHVSNKYAEVMDLRAFPYSPQLLNPVGFTGGQNSITLKRSATAPPGSALMVSTYVLYECILTLSGGIINVTE